MKAIFIAYNQAYNEEIVNLLEDCGQRGYTLWNEIGDRTWATTPGLPRITPCSRYWTMRSFPR